MQKVNFSWELIIADDFSTDGTRDIICDYARKYPDFIKLILQEKNVGAAKNWLDLITFPKSKYIAYFEGDDYWTDPEKLQKQVDILNENTDLVSTFHMADWLDQNTGVLTKNIYRPSFEKIYYTKKDLLENSNFIPTCSIVFRNRENLLPDWILKVNLGDFALHILNSDYGKHRYINESMGVHRKHINGLYGGQTEIQKKLKILKFYDIIEKHVEFSFDEKSCINNLISKVCYEASILYFREKKIKESLDLLNESKQRGFNSEKIRLQRIKIKYPFIVFRLYAYIINIKKIGLKGLLGTKIKNHLVLLKLSFHNNSGSNNSKI